MDGQNGREAKAGTKASGSEPRSPSASEDESGACPRSAAAGTVRWRSEIGSLLRLAVPVALAELGWMAMGVVDTLCVGRLGAEALGAVGLAHILFFGVAIAGVGFMLGLDAVVSQDFGAGRRDDCRRWLREGVYLALALSAPLAALVLGLSSRLAPLGIDPAVISPTSEYMTISTIGLPSLLLYFGFRRYLQATDRIGAIVFALISANVINLASNWILIYGNFGAPRLGVAGSAWATVISRSWMAGVLCLSVARERGGSRIGWAPDFWRLRRLVKLGTPAAGQLLLEVWAFAAATALIGRLDPSSLAAHQIALMVASVTFMVPLGMSSAAAVRVGQAIGRGDPGGARRSGWMAIGLAAGFMATASIVLVAAPHIIVRIYTGDPRVILPGVLLLRIAALFQISDGIQVVATGCLRGVGDTRTPMVANLLAHWGIGLPVGVGLCFGLNRGVGGMWLGLSAGLMSVAALLVVAWGRRAGRLNEGSPARDAATAIEPRPQDQAARVSVPKAEEGGCLMPNG